MLSLQVLIHILIGKRLELAMGTFRTFKLLFVTECSIPFIQAYRLIPGLVGSTAIPTSSKHILLPRNRLRNKATFSSKDKRTSGCSFWKSAAIPDSPPCFSIPAFEAQNLQIQNSILPQKVLISLPKFFICISHIHKSIIYPKNFVMANSGIFSIQSWS